MNNLHLADISNAKAFNLALQSHMDQQKEYEGQSQCQTVEHGWLDVGITFGQKGYYQTVERERRSTANEGENGRRDDGRMGREVQSVLLALLVFNAPSSHSCTTDGKSAVGSQVV